jgi:hypothetical protein
MSKAPHSYAATIKTLSEVLDSVKAAQKSFAPAFNARERASMSGFSHGYDIRCLLASVDMDLRTLQARIEEALSKLSPSFCPIHTKMPDMGNGTFACGCNGVDGMNEAQREGRA